MIRPGDGNYLLSNQAHKALKHTLDRVLSAPPLPSAPTPRPPVLDPQMDLTTLSVNNNLFADFAQEDGFDFLNWIDSMEWDKGPWMSTINQM
jgi:hypothetical protein